MTVPVGCTCSALAIGWTLYMSQCDIGFLTEVMGYVEAQDSDRHIWNKTFIWKRWKGIFLVIFMNMFPAVFVSSGTNHIAVMINMKCQVWNSIHHSGLLGVNIPGLSMVVLDDLYWNQVLCVHEANLVLKPVICGGKTQPLCSIAFKEGCDIWRLQCLILLPMYYILYLESSSENGASQFLWQACILY